MKKKAAGALFCVLLILAAALYMNRERNDVQEPEFVFTYAENQSEDYPTTLGGYKFAQLVEERTHGRIKILVRANEALGDEKSVIEQIQFGGVDFARVSLSPLADYIPKLNVLQMPYLYRDSGHMWKVLDGTVGDDFLGSFKGFDMVALAWYDAGARSFYNSVKPIRSVEDMKGMKIRVQESAMMETLMEELGAVAVPLAYGDVYSGLQTGAIDGAENNWPSYESSGHYEVAGYFTVDEHARVPEVQICSQATWDKLTQEDRRLISDCARESAVYERKLWTEREKRSRELVLDRGVKVTELSPEEKAEFQEAVKGIYDIYCVEYADIIKRIKETR